MVLNDADIRKLCLDEQGMCLPHPMLYPFSEGVSGNGVISYGLTHSGYDLRLDPEEVLLFNHWNDYVIDPKRFNQEEYKNKVFTRLPIFADTKFKWVVLPAHSYALGKSFEYFRMPRHLKARVGGKSTLARSGISINTTDIEAGWNGFLVIEIANLAPSPARLYLCEGIGQVEFSQLTAEPEICYAQKGGKYQGQTGITVAKVL